MGKTGTWLTAVKKALSASKDTAVQDQQAVDPKHPSISDGRKEITETQQKKSFKEKNRWSFRRSSRNLLATSELHLHPGNNTNQHQDTQNRHRQSGNVPYLSGNGNLEKSSTHNQNQDKQVLAVAAATAAAAEAAVAAAQAAAQIVKLTGAGRSGCSSNNITPFPHKSIIGRRNQEELAAIRIQAAFRAYLARRTYRTLKGLARLQALTQGRVGQKQTTATMRCMQALVRAQAAVRGRRRTRPSGDTDALGETMSLHHPATWNMACELSESRSRGNAALPADMNEKGIPKQDVLKVQQGLGWDYSTQTIEQIQARELSRHEAAVKRERAMAYAFAHQQLHASTYSNGKVSTTPQLGWNWLERWMAAKPWENRRPCSAKEVITHARTTSTSLAPISTMPRRQASPLRRVSAPTTPAPLHFRHPTASRTGSPARSAAVVTPLLGSFSAPATRICGNPFAMSSQAPSLASSSMRDDMSLASFAGTPGYMATTESARARAKLRSHSTPKQRACGIRSATTSLHSDDVGANASSRKRLYFTNGDISSSARNFMSLRPSATLQRNHSFEAYSTKSKF